MKRHSDNNCMFEIKIEENLEKFHRQKMYPTRPGGKTSPQMKKNKNKKNKLFQQHKWNIIKRHLRVQQERGADSKEIAVQRKPPSVQELMQITTHSQMLQYTIIGLATFLANCRRIPLIWIFLRNALSIVFNAYNLVVFLLAMAFGDPTKSPLSLGMLLLFYGFNILLSSLSTFLTIIVYQSLNEEIKKAGPIADEWNIYISDENVKARLSQLSALVNNNVKTFTLYGLVDLNGSLINSLISGTVTYIIILIQYSENGEFSQASQNQTKT
ncbi:uncharacterized protein [Musca autumnalis]|uniref:uncharacterized protein n=1 Tax=Musca autumnalis TaxID=221902 RepID=UPI003CF2610F